MIKKALAMLAVALTVLLLLPVDPADARRGGGGGGFRAGGFRAAPMRPATFRVAPVYRPRVIVSRPVIVHRPVRYVRRVAPVVVVGGGCEWLRQRAVLTGSPYWWRRYRLCRGY